MMLIPLALGYATGRAGHVLGGNNTPSFHHWIIGLLMFLYSKDDFYKIFGIGLMISDLDDMLNLRVYGVAPVEKYVFWGFD